MLLPGFPPSVLVPHCSHIFAVFKEVVDAEDKASLDELSPE